jgi:hypothetical protein
MLAHTKANAREQRCVLGRGEESVVEQAHLREIERASEQACIFLLLDIVRCGWAVYTQHI